MAGNDSIWTQSSYDEQVIQPPACIEPSLYWPQVLHHPELIGARVTVTSLNDNGNTATYEATVLEIAADQRDEAALIFINITQKGDSIMDKLIIAHSSIKALTMHHKQPKVQSPQPILDEIYLSEKREQTPMCYNMDDPQPISLPPSRLVQNSDFAALQANKSVVNIPFLEDGRVDLFHLQQTYKLQNTEYSFYEWMRHSGIDTIMIMNGMRHGIPMQYQRMIGVNHSTKKIRSLWEETFPSHRLSFDTWFPLEGVEPYERYLIEEMQLKQTKEDQEAECVPNESIEGRQIPDIQSFHNESMIASSKLSADHRQSTPIPFTVTFISPYFKYEDLMANNTEQDLDSDKSSLFIRGTVNRQPINYEATLSILDLDRPFPNRIPSVATSIMSQLKFTEHDFLPNGKYAHHYIPAYKYIPVQLIKELGIENKTWRDVLFMLTWLKLQQCRRQAEALLQCSPEDFCIQKDIKPTPWLLTTSKLRFPDKMDTNLLDHVQHWSAWKYFHKYRDVISRDEFYDLFLRPVEAVYALDCGSKHDMKEAVLITSKRLQIQQEFARITGTEHIINKYMDPHTILTNWTRIRHLSQADLLNKGFVTTGPLQILPSDNTNVRASNPDEPGFTLKEKEQLKRLIKLKIANEEQEFSITSHSVPLTNKFLEHFEQFGGLSMNLTKQEELSFLLLCLNDTIQAESTQEDIFEQTGWDPTDSESDRSFERVAHLTLDNLATQKQIAIEQEQTTINQPALYQFDEIEKMKQFQNKSVAPLKPERNKIHSDLFSWKSVSSDTSMTDTDLNSLELLESRCEKLKHLEELNEILVMTPQSHSVIMAEIHQLEDAIDETLDREPEQEIGALSTFSDSLAGPKGAQADQESTLKEHTHPLDRIYRETVQMEQYHSILEHHLNNISLDTSTEMAYYKREQDPVLTGDLATEFQYSEALIIENAKQTAPIPIKSTQQTNMIELRQPPGRKQRSKHFTKDNQVINHHQGSRANAPSQGDRRGAPAPSRHGGSRAYAPSPMATLEHRATYRPPSQPALKPLTQARAREDQTSTALTPLTTAKAESDKYAYEKMVDLQAKLQVKEPKAHKTPKGINNSHISRFTEIKRNIDRQPQQIIASPVTQEELSGSMVLPFVKEPYVSIFWTTTGLLDKIPKWATIPHSARTITQATEPNPINNLKYPNRFYSDKNLCVFPMDDNVFKREMTFESFRHNQQWFLKIKEELEYPDSTIEISSVNLPWKKANMMAHILRQVWDTPLQRAKEMLWVSPGTYTSQSMEGGEHGFSYYVDVLQQPYKQGWLRMVHISQEQPLSLTQEDNISQTKIEGNISFPWHKMSIFVDKFDEFIADV